MRPKIMHVIATLDQSGAEKQLTLLARALPAAGYDTLVCALTRGGPFVAPLEEAGVRVEVLHKRLKADPLTLVQLVRLMRQFRPQLVHTWMFTANTYGRLAARLAGVPHLVAGERCVDSWKADWQWQVDRFFLSRTDCLVFNSQAAAHFYHQKGIQGPATQVIPNGIALPDLGDRSHVRATRRAQLGIAVDQPVVGFVGRLTPQKGLRDLLWAVDLLRQMAIAPTLVLVGDGPERESLQQWCRQLRLEDVVRFVGHQPKVAEDWLPIFDLFVLPSRFEGMSNSMLEAMAGGIPVVATQIPGMDEVIDDGVTGRLVPVGEPYELARTLHELLADPASRQRLAAQGMARVRQFGVKSMVAAYLGLYRRLLG